MTRQLFSAGYRDQTLPARLILDVAELVSIFKGHWDGIVDRNSHLYSFPDADAVIKYVLSSVKQETDVDMEFSIKMREFLLSMKPFILVYERNDSKLPRLGVELYTLMMNFGKALVAKLREDHAYCNGYFPYHFRGWIDGTIYVSLDKRHYGSSPGVLFHDNH